MTRKNFFGAADRIKIDAAHKKCCILFLIRGLRALFFCKNAFHIPAERRRSQIDGRFFHRGQVRCGKNRVRRCRGSKQPVQKRKAKQEKTGRLIGIRVQAGKRPEPDISDGERKKRISRIPAIQPRIHAMEKSTGRKHQNAAAINTMSEALSSMAPFLLTAPVFRARKPSSASVAPQNT